VLSSGFYEKVSAKKVLKGIQNSSSYLKLENVN